MLSSVKQKKRMRERRRTLQAQGICISCAAEPAHEPFLYCTGCAGRRSLRAKTRLVAVRRAILKLYGGKCVCCGERNEVFLTLDHINNDGHRDRRQGLNGEMLCRALLKSPRRDLQLLCYNCNGAKGRIGVCPHSVPSADLTWMLGGGSKTRRLPTYAPSPEGSHPLRSCAWPDCGVIFPAISNQKYCKAHQRPNDLLKMKLWRQRKKDSDGMEKVKT